MSGSMIILLCAFAGLLTAGQMVFKMTARSVGAVDLADPASLLALAGNAWFWAALAIYGVATVLWIAILQKVALSTAFPFAALTFVMVPLAAALLFGEPLSLRYALGIACVIGGLYLTAS